MQAENGYTWYRKYAGGWVEQGGRCSGEATKTTITLPCSMRDRFFTIVATTNSKTSHDGCPVEINSATSITLYKPNSVVWWRADGYAA